MDALLKDLRFALRGLLRKPGFTFVAVLSLALGIGANGTVFSLVDGMLFRPLPGVQDGDRLVRIYSQSKSLAFPLGVSVPNFEDVAAATDEIFTGFGGQMPVSLGVSVDDQPPQVAFGLAIYGDYFGVLGTLPDQGRLITETDVDDFERVVVVGHDYWRDQLGADPDIVGKALKINGESFTVVGVAERDFTGTEVLMVPSLWLPLTSAETLLAPGILEERGSRGLRMTARMAPGVEMAGAQSALEAISTHLAAEYEDNRGEAHMAMLENDARIEAGLGDASRLFGVLLLALVGGVLLIACANVANLVLARADGRRRELAVQVAIGAGRWQLVRRHLVESVALATLGGLVGVAMAFPLANTLANLEIGGNLPIRLAAEPNLTVVLFMGVVTLLAGVAFGILPALRASRTDPAGALRALPGLQGGKFSFGSVLVVGQVAVSLVLLIAAGLFLRSLQNAGDIDLGFDARGIGAVTFELGTAGLDDDEGRVLLDRVERRVAELPGVDSVVAASPLPMDWSANGFNLGLDRDLGEDLGNEMLVLSSWVGPGYFETMKTPILAGRAFTETDDADHPRVLIVNEALAERVWPGESAIGRSVRIGGQNGDPAEVVGVVPTGKYRLPGEAPRPYAFVPLEQDFRGRLTVVVSSRRPLGGVLEQVRQEVLATHPNLAIESSQPFADTVESRVIGPIGLVATLAGAFGVIGLLLAAVGLYGVMALQVVHRTREIGIRMALGAGARSVLGGVIRRGLGLAAVGLVIGTGLGFLATRLMGSFVIGVSPQDPTTFAAVILLLAAVAVVASLVPAVRASLIDPVRTLKAD